jgi:hypothetical protein
MESNGMNYTLKLVGRICMGVIVFALALWVMLSIGHEKQVQCSIVSGEISKTVTKDNGKSTSCSNPHLVVQYIANNQSFTSPATDSPVSEKGNACLSPEDAKAFSANYPVNSFQTCWYDPQNPLNVHFHKTAYKPLSHLCLRIAFFSFCILIVTKLLRRKPAPPSA